MKRSLLALLLLTPVAYAPGSPLLAQGPKGAKITWKKTVVDKVFRSEGVAVADVNKDGKLDIIVGDVWYEAPDWKMHPLRKERFKSHDPKAYSEAFAVFAGDFNGDGFPDVIVIPFPGKECFWYENPKGKHELWKEHRLTNSACNETPIFVDLFKTGKKVLVMGWRPPGKGFGEVCYFQPGKDPTKEWERISISGNMGKDAPGSGQFYHGLGSGDVNGDGRNDIITPDGWWEQPEKQEGQPWKWHPTRIGQSCADMHVMDVTGKRDIISSSAHGYGLWCHQQRPGNVFLTMDLFATPPMLAKEPKGFKFSKEEQHFYAAINKAREARRLSPWRPNAMLCEAAREWIKEKNPKFKVWKQYPGEILAALVFDLNERADADLGALFLQPFKELPAERVRDPRLEIGFTVSDGRFAIIYAARNLFSLPGQTHALHLVDINGDGLKDLVTGRRWWAHGPTGDVSPGDPAYLYWFEAKKDATGMISFVPHVIDDDSGIGTQFEVIDINGDGLPDIVISNKKGVYVFAQVRTEIAPAGKKD